MNWQLQCEQWLLKNLGGIKSLKQYQTLYPTSKHFPRASKSGKADANHVFAQVADNFNVDQKQFLLEQQEVDINPHLGPHAIIQNAPTSRLGTYSTSQTNHHLISYSPSNLKNLDILISTFAHEICHPILLSIFTLPPGGHEAEEIATDLAMVFFGFGIFGGNESFQFNQYSDSSTGPQGWMMNRSGYLLPNEWGFAMSVRAQLTDENTDKFKKHSSMNLYLNFKKNMKFLTKNPSTLEHLISI